ncbi:hypothetical protein CO074_00660 [bacterium (Candidatus Moisslbacteria) CG_4_9_14_0_8_um_filter_36_20]|nr:MAG: hypothetical protein CO074_00660 [bacterium (Candidatus Moisslbacteria) CG_4_9_14_0_8_um_filter_36_20]
MPNLTIQKISSGKNKELGTYCQIYADERFILLSGLSSPLDEKIRKEEKLKFLKEFNDKFVEFLKKNSLEIKFEELLKKANQWLKEEGKGEIESNFLLLGLKNEKIYFSSLGDIGIYLIEGREIQDISQKSEENEFTQLTSGALNEGSLMIFATSDLSPIRIEDVNKLEKIVKQSRSGAILKIENKSFKEILKEFSPETKAASARFEKPRLLTKKLSYPQKSLIVILIIISLLFVQNLFFNVKQKGTVEENNFKNKTSLIEEKEKEIFLLSLGDREKVYGLLSEIENLLGELQQGNLEEKETFQKLENNYLDNLKKFFAYTVVSEPKLLVNLELFDKNFLPTKLIEMENNLYTFDPKNNYLYRIDKNSGKIFLLKDTRAQIEQIFAFDKDSFVILDKKGNFTSFNLSSGELKPLKLERSHELKKIEDFSIYANRIYTLEESGIYRYRKTADGFSREEKWLKESADFKETKAMSIDGAIYVLGPNEISKFYLGKKENFGLEKILPEISNFFAIFTNAESNYLYLLEQNRLLIFDKNGKIIKQISSPKFIDLKGFIVNEKEKKAWLIEGQKIYEINLF